MSFPGSARLGWLPRVISVALGIFLVFAACAKYVMMRRGLVDLGDEVVNGIIMPVELLCGVMLCTSARRLAALFLALAMPLALAFAVFLHLAGYEAQDWWWFLPSPLPFGLHLLVLAALAAGGIAVCVREVVHLSSGAIMRSVRGLRHLVSVFE